MWPIDLPVQWVDRSRELATLRAGVEALRHGGGAAVWVEGEPGIGKSSLVVEALAGTSELGWDIGWGIADQLAERLPLSESRSQALVIRSKHGASVMAKPAHHNRKGAMNRATPLGLIAHGITEEQSDDPPTLALRASAGLSPPKRGARRWKQSGPRGRTRWLAMTTSGNVLATRSAPECCKNVGWVSCEAA